MRDDIVAKLAGEAFDKAERLRMLSMMNTPIDYEGRRKAAIEMALARQDSNRASAALDSAISSTVGVPEATKDV